MGRIIQLLRYSPTSTHSELTNRRHDWVNGGTISLAVKKPMYVYRRLNIISRRLAEVEEVLPI